MYKHTKTLILFSILAVVGYAHADGGSIAWVIKAVCAPSFEKECVEKRKLFQSMADDHAPHSFLEGDNFIMSSTLTQNVTSLNDVCEDKCQSEFYSDYKKWEKSQEIIIAGPQSGIINSDGGVSYFDPDDLVPVVISLKWIRHFCSQCNGMTTEPLPTCLLAVFEKTDESGSAQVRYQAELLSQISHWIVIKEKTNKISKITTWSMIKNEAAYTDDEDAQPTIDELNKD